MMVVLEGSRDDVPAPDSGNFSIKNGSEVGKDDCTSR
jgi:hypothetical protein